MNSSHFTDTRLIACPEADPLLGRVLARYGLRLDDPAPKALVQLKISLPPGSALLWDRATSLPRGPLRRQLLRSVSLTLQDALRCWIPYLWLSNPLHWQEAPRVWPMLIYAASRTFKPVSRQCYTFDLLSESTVPAILRSSWPILREWLPRLRALHPSGRELRQQRLLEMVERHDFNPHYLKRLLAHEQKLIAAFMELADSHCEQPGSERLGTDLHRHLTRIYTNVDFSFLAPLLYIEIENTLAVHLLGRSILQSSLQVQVPPPDAEPFGLPLPGFVHAARRPQPNSD